MPTTKTRLRRDQYGNLLNTLPISHMLKQKTKKTRRPTPDIRTRFVDGRHTNKDISIQEKENKKEFHDSDAAFKKTFPDQEDPREHYINPHNTLAIIHKFQEKSIKKDEKSRARHSDMGKASCKPTSCPAGKAGIKPPNCTDCSTGRYSQAMGLTQCRDCPAGYVTREQGMADCTRCPSYQTTAFEGASDYRPMNLLSLASLLALASAFPGSLTICGDVSRCNTTSTSLTALSSGKVPPLPLAALSGPPPAESSRPRASFTSSPAVSSTATRQRGIRGRAIEEHGDTITVAVHLVLEFAGIDLLSHTNLITAIINNDGENYYGRFASTTSISRGQLLIPVRAAVTALGSAVPRTVAVDRGTILHRRRGAASSVRDVGTAAAAAAAAAVAVCFKAAPYCCFLEPAGWDPSPSLESPSSSTASSHTRGLSRFPAGVAAATSSPGTYVAHHDGSRS